jgi:hypothetical protein
MEFEKMQHAKNWKLKKGRNFLSRRVLQANKWDRVNNFPLHLNLEAICDLISSRTRRLSRWKRKIAPSLARNLFVKSKTETT